MICWELRMLRTHKTGKTRFILNHPGYTHSGTNHFAQPFKGILRVMGKLFAKPVGMSMKPIIKLMDNPLYIITLLIK